MKIKHRAFVSNKRIKEIVDLKVSVVELKLFILKKFLLTWYVHYAMSASHHRAEYIRS